VGGHHHTVISYSKHKQETSPLGWGGCVNALAVGAHCTNFVTLMFLTIIFPITA
jgi:hypothetical protein